MSKTQEEIDADLDAAAAKPLIVTIDGQTSQRQPLQSQIELAKFRQSQSAATPSKGGWGRCLNNRAGMPGTGC